ncbi:MAG: hypothetical protein F6J93_09795 [Oscillatoria sp. SIO1A7]|nr:hypothetical protein [Oscillatoria sp. SIO1A7]
MTDIVFGELTSSDLFDATAEAYYDDYLLTAPFNGGFVTLELSSEELDPYLEVYDRSTGELLYDNDDGGDGLNSRIEFIAERDGSYVVRASSFGLERGRYTLEVLENGTALQALGGNFQAGQQLTALPSRGNFTGQLISTDPFDGSAYYDDYLLSLQDSGTVTVDLTSNDVDSYLEIYRQGTGELLYSNDDWTDGTLDAQLRISGLAGDRYLVRASSFSQEQGSYNLNIRSLGNIASLQPFSGAAAVQTTAPIRANFSGQLNNSDPQTSGTLYDDYQVTANSNAPLTIDLTGDFDTYLYIYDKNGRVVAFDDDSGDGLNSQIEFTPEAGEIYTLRATSYAPTQGNYTLQASSFASVALAPINPISNGSIAALLNDTYGQIYLGNNPSFLNDPFLLKIFQGLIAANASLDFKDYSQSNDSIQLGSGFSSSFPGGLRAFGGSDDIVGSNGDDVINGNQGNDTVDGLFGNDYLRGGRDDDLLRGGEGNDIVNGNRGADILDGGFGNDYMRGGSENDLLIGGEGNDVLVGDRGRDTLIGGNGADTFVLRADLATFDRTAADRIQDFDSFSDRIAISGGLSPNQIDFESVVDGTAITIAATGEFLGIVEGQFLGGLHNSLISIQLNDLVLDRIG